MELTQKQLDVFNVFKNSPNESFTISEVASKMGVMSNKISILIVNLAKIGLLDYEVKEILINNKNTTVKKYKISDMGKKININLK